MVDHKTWADVAFVVGVALPSLLALVSSLVNHCIIKKNTRKLDENTTLTRKAAAVGEEVRNLVNGQNRR